MGIAKYLAAGNWNRAAGRPVRNWWDSPRLQQYVNEQICGKSVDSDGAIAAALVSAFPGRDFRRGVSIGCGNAAKEIALLKSGIVREFDLSEISQAQVAAGTRALISDGLESRARYVLKSPLADGDSRGQYDFVYWDHALHHMPDVAEALMWSCLVLAPTGVICINDYVGPTRLQWTRGEAKIANDFLRASERKFCMTIPGVAPGNLMRRFRMILRDPSEAPQSDLIQSASATLLEGFTLRPIGGAILNMCGSNVMNLPHVPEGLIEDMIVFDRKCLDGGLYHFAFGIWENR